MRNTNNGQSKICYGQGPETRLRTTWSGLRPRIQKGREKAWPAQGTKLKKKGVCYIKKQKELPEIFLQILQTNLLRYFTMSLLL